MTPQSVGEIDNYACSPHKSNRGPAVALGLLALVVSTFLSVVPAHAERFYIKRYNRRVNVTPSSFRSQTLDREVRYSIYLPPGYFDDESATFPVIYYLHGFDTKGIAYLDWLKWRLDEALDAMIASGESREMIVVMPECFGTGLVVNWGRPPPPKAPPLLTFPFRLLRGALRSIDDPTYLGTFLYIHRWDLTRSDYADFLTGEFVRHIEDTYRVASGKDSRALCGFSTGGFSALSIALRNPGLFDSVSAHAPMLVSGSPFSSNAGEMFVEFDPDTEDFIPQRFTINILRRIFINEETWRANNPIDLAREQRGAGMSVYIDVAEGDKRRYDAGAKELVSALRENGAKVRFNIVEGLAPASSHTYPGFLNGKIIARHAEGKSEKELRTIYGWKNIRELINPDVQRIKHSLTFHSQEFANGRSMNSSPAAAY